MSSQQGSRLEAHYVRTHSPAQTPLATYAPASSLRSPNPFWEVTS